MFLTRVQGLLRGMQGTTAGSNAASLRAGVRGAVMGCRSLWSGMMSGSGVGCKGTERRDQEALPEGARRKEVRSLATLGASVMASPNTSSSSGDMNSFDYMKNGHNEVLPVVIKEDYMTLPDGKEMKRLGLFNASERSIQRGEKIIRFSAQEYQEHADRYTIQLSERVHISCESLGKGRFLNHSCDPNATILWPDVHDIDHPEERAANTETNILDKENMDTYLVALREIGSEEEITFNYLLSEEDMDVKFACACGSRSCYGFVGGYRHLEKEQKKLLLPWASPYIRSLPVMDP
eukprot:Nk52_evm1s193 gene=Nk52_evmTU1s193